LKNKIRSDVFTIQPPQGFVILFKFMSQDIPVQKVRVVPVLPDLARRIISVILGM